MLWKDEGTLPQCTNLYGVYSGNTLIFASEEDSLSKLMYVDLSGILVHSTDSSPASGISTTESDIGCCGGNVAFNERGSLIQLDPTGGHSGPRCSGCSSMPVDRKEGDRLSLRKKWTPDLLPKPVRV